jgi:ferritin-like metal-binding protein YciE
MPIKDPKEVFLLLLSHIREGADRASSAYDDISQLAKDPEIKEVLEARAFVNAGILQRLDQCFKILGEKPMPLPGRVRETFMEDLRNDLSEIQSPVARHLYILAKLVRLTHLRLGEYVALTAAADVTGNHAVGLLLESCLADKLAFVERTRRLIRHVAEERIAERRAA